MSFDEEKLCPKKKKRYENPHIRHIRRGLFDVFLWKTGYYKEFKHWSKAPDSFVYPIPEKELDENLPSAVWINHCTFLITIEDINILTDPIWSERCSPLSFAGPKRRHSPPIHLADLPKIDYVFISHNHYDHLDKKTVRWLNARYPEIIWFVPEGVKKWFVDHGVAEVIELSWWQESGFKHEHDPRMHIKVTAVPTQHFSGRTPLDINQTLWVGWVVEFQKEGELMRRLYFVGDTGYNPHDFKKIGEKWGYMDLSLIPIGTYLPREFMSPVHIEPADSVKIHREVGSRLSLGMHWKTFPLSDEPLNQPPFDLLLAMQEEKLDPASFLPLEPGYPINW